MTRGMKKIRDSLIEQLKARGADVPLFNALIDDYIWYCEQENDMQKDIKDRGRTYITTSAAGNEYEKENPSVKNALMYNKQKLAILKQMNSAQREWKPPMSMMTECNEISDYIGIVRSGAVAVCAEQLKLCEYVEFIFETEKLCIDSDQLQKYLNLQKYFPYRLLPWELFCFTLHNCVYREDGQLRWPKLFILVGRGAGKNGYLAFEDFCLLTPINGVKYYNIDIFAMAEKQAKATFEDIYQVLEDNASRLSKYWYWTKEEIINLKTKSKLTFHTSGIKSADGGRPGKIDHDEYHAYEGYKLVSTTITGLGKKAHPRRTIISTNGNVRGGPLDDMIKKSERILNREIPDNGFCRSSANWTTSGKFTIKGTGIRQIQAFVIFQR